MIVTILHPVVPQDSRRLSLARRGKQPKKTPEVFTPGEVIRLLRINRRTLGVWARNGLINYSKTDGGERRYSELELRRILGRTYNALIGPDDPDKLLTSREVAELCDVCTQTVHTWAKMKRISGIRLLGGRYYRFLESEARAFAERR